VGKRINVDGPGDDPDEYWFECEDCEGAGAVNVPDGLDESISVSAECPDCGGLGFYEGDADDVDD
jgi:DnaJ-class molecular chaperone